MTQVVLVLGMHRSGTSCLAGCLEQAGLHLGDVIRQARHNKKGNRENQRIMDLHEAVLKESGGSWDDPPETVRWTDERRAQRDEILESYKGVSRWGFKDPRTLFTLSGWLEVLEGVTFVGTFRHPISVAESLRRRNQGTVERWVELWGRYNERLLELHQRHRFPLISFDLPDDRYRANLERVISALELTPQAADAFFEPGLRNQAPPNGPVPESARSVYERLLALSSP